VSNQAVSIIIPCLDEEDNVKDILSSLLKALEANPIPYEIIVVDDQSRDATLTRAEQWLGQHPGVNMRVLHKALHRRGYGAAVKYGLAYATGKYAVFVSADLVDPIHLLHQMYARLLEGADLVQCSRYLVKSDASTIPFSYKFYQFFFRIGVRIALGKYIPDSTYAFKMFDRAKIQAMGISANRFNISPEIMFKSILANLKIVFIPGSQGIRANGTSKFKFTKEGIGFGACLIRSFLHRHGLSYWF
jgi:dolichol-phosphate mannosyltransferase